jgi:hypothetical protein
MIRLKDLLSEKRKTFDVDIKLLLADKSIELIRYGYLPLTPKIANIIYGDVVVRGYHMTDSAGIKQLINIQGSKKAVSITTTILNSKELCGPARCGVGVYIEGTLLFNAWRDLASKPDEAGRRWVDISEFNSDFHMEYIEYIKSDEEFDKIVNNNNRFIQSIADNDIKSNKEGVAKSINNFKRSFISRYIFLTEKFFSYKANADKVRWLAASSGKLKNSQYGNNELIVNKIKVIDVILNNDAIRMNKKDISKVKSNISGSLYPTSHVETRNKFFSSKVGIVKFYNSQ